MLLIHGAGGSATQFQAQALRLASNGYPADPIAAFEYDSTFSTATLADVHTALDVLATGLRERSGAAKVDVVAEGAGTFVAQTYLHSDPARAAGVAHYVNLDGGAGAPSPPRVATLAVWGSGRRDRDVTGATNLRFGNLRHDELLRSPRTFAALFRFLTDVEPATVHVVPSSPVGEVPAEGESAPGGSEGRPGITISGRAVVEPFNLGVAGGVVEVRRAGRSQGGVTDPAPLATFPLGDDGAWGPLTVAPGQQRYELAVLRDGRTVGRRRVGPFLRSDHLVRVTTPEPGPELGGLMVDALAASGGYVSIPGADDIPSPERQPGPFDCEGPMPDAQPGTPEWFGRDANNLFCTQQRHLDKLPHPVTPQPTGSPALDAYREPSRHDDVRFRYDTATIGGLRAEVYRPCAAGTCTGTPRNLRTFEPPYPAVVTLHGGGSNKELHWWSSQALAEAGYLVVAFDGANQASARTVLDWLHTSSDPLAAEFDGAHVGIAGHSIGGDAAAALGHGDPRISAVVYWDRAGLSSPAAGALRSPTLAVMGDYGCTAPLVCPLEPRAALPDPAARGAKAQDFGRLRDAGVDTMQVALRGVTHFDWVPDMLSGNRYAELVNTYYMVAWFDRYLRGATDPAVAADAYRRLTATAFDDSADRHNISQGRYDPARVAATGDPYAGNVPYRIGRMPVADRLSFYYPSRCFLTVPDGSSVRAVSDDLRRDRCAPA